MKRLLVIVGFLVIAVAVASGLQDCPAEDGEHPVFFEDPDDCGSFYECAYGKAHHIQCPPGTYYHPEINVCDFLEYAECGSRPTTPSPAPTPEPSSKESGK
ncbi:peritrophin-1-like [Rhynchophorus ferrugineus]|uniref:peritrophin-1-like n=1 Tax=Rhynchophorus ferrugineus TaxID=354439 RepID=UPI003FCEA120